MSETKRVKRLWQETPVMATIALGLFDGPPIDITNFGKDMGVGMVLVFVFLFVSLIWMIVHGLQNHSW